jgi:hypothetical protein
VFNNPDRVSTAGSVTNVLAEYTSRRETVSYGLARTMGPLGDRVLDTAAALVASVGQRLVPKLAPATVWRPFIWPGARACWAEPPTVGPDVSSTAILSAESAGKESGYDQIGQRQIPARHPTIGRW